LSPFYPFFFPSAIWGHAMAFLLPFFLSFCYLGQCNGFPFTLLPFLLPFGAMQWLSFYPASVASAIWGNAMAFLLPFFLSFCYLGQCNGFSFTLFPFLLSFGAMQWLSFYPFSFPSAIWGKAMAFLLPFFLSF
jgi:hypothetical protein